MRLKTFEGKRLPVGARLTFRVTKVGVIGVVKTLTFRVTKDGMIGVVKTLTIRKRKAPSLKTLCLPPGATRPSAC